MSLEHWSAFARYNRWMNELYDGLPP